MKGKRRGLAACSAAKNNGLSIVNHILIRSGIRKACALNGGASSAVRQGAMSPAARRAPTPAWPVALWRRSSVGGAGLLPRGLVVLYRRLLRQLLLKVVGLPGRKDRGKGAFVGGQALRTGEAEPRGKESQAEAWTRAARAPGCCGASPLLAAALASRRGKGDRAAGGEVVGRPAAPCGDTAGPQFQNLAMRAAALARSPFSSMAASRLALRSAKKLEGSRSATTCGLRLGGARVGSAE